MPQPYPSDHENAIPLDRVTGDPFPSRLRSRPRTTRGGTRKQPSPFGSFGPFGSLGPGLPFLAIGPLRSELSIDTFGAFNADLSGGPSPGGAPPSRVTSGGTSPSGPSPSGPPPSGPPPSRATPSRATPGGTPPGRPAARDSANTTRGEADPAAAASDHPAASTFPRHAECDAVHPAVLQAGDPGGLHCHAVRVPRVAATAAGDPAAAAGGEEGRAA